MTYLSCIDFLGLEVFLPLGLHNAKYFFLSLSFIKKVFFSIPKFLSDKFFWFEGSDIKLFISFFLLNGKSKFSSSFAVSSSSKKELKFKYLEELL